MRNYLCCTDFNRAGLNKLLSYILAVYKECKATTFPIDCVSILQHYGFRVLNYSELKEINVELYTICQSCTEDAFTYEKIIAYNEKKPPERIRFSLMHELGHFIMSLPSTDKSFEDLADYFASNILVPRATIWHMRSDSVRNICRTYGVSCMAANRIYKDYKMCHLSECKEINQEIHDCFFPISIPEPARSIIKPIEIIKDDDEEYEPTPKEMYADIQRTLKAGLPLSTKYASLYRMYRKMGLK